MPSVIKKGRNHIQDFISTKNFHLSIKMGASSQIHNGKGR